MPSKGIRIHAFLSVEGISIDFYVPGRTETYSTPHEFYQELLEIDKSNIGGLHFTGRFQFTVKRGEDVITTQWIDINCLTGHMGDGTLHSLSQTPSIVLPDLIVCYGFYDAGQHPQGGLPNEDQCYVTVTPNHSEFMKELVPPGSPGVHKPFSSFVLPAVHDVGMNTMQNAIALLHDAGDAVLKLSLAQIGLDASIHFGIGDAAVRHIAPNIIESLSITQKDDLQTLLAIGARYFEFRPAHVADQMKDNNPLGDELYFQHACIPGMAFSHFLSGVVEFLQQKPFEIVVVQIRFDGVLAQCAKPDNAAIDAAVQTALGNTGIQRGHVQDLLNATVRDLRSANRRLIVMNSVNSYSSYTDEAYATVNGDSILAEFEGLDTSKQEGAAFTNLQCQATASNIRNAVIYSALSANSSNSCLMATKAICDGKTLPWIRANALGKLTAQQLIVIMNDFFDGATADVAIELSRQRLAA